MTYLIIFRGVFNIMEIMIVEDNISISKPLSYSLKASGFDTVVCGTFEEAIKNSGRDYDVMIIDVTLPDGNGFELYEEIKKYNDSPVIFLTALDDENNIVKGLELGAEDYMTKPFSTRELIARIKRITRKKDVSRNVIVSGDISIDLDSKTVSNKGELVEITALEYRILSMLAQNMGMTVTRDVILQKIWDISGNYVNDNTLTVYIKRIRQKLDTDSIKTVKGIGYRMEKL